MSEPCGACGNPLRRARCTWCNGEGWVWKSGDKAACSVCGGTGGREYCPCKSADRAAGRELDAAIAERVMGLRVAHPAWPCGYYPDGCSIEIMHADTDENREPDSWHTELRPIHQVRAGDPDNSDTHTYRFLCEVVPAYSIDIAAAWLVVERMRARGYYVTIMTGPNARNRVTIEWFDPDLPDRPSCVTREADPMPLAVCRAALAAMR